MIEQALRSNPIGPLLIEFLPEYLSADYRLAFFEQFTPLPPFSSMAEVSMAAVGARIAPDWADGPLELTVVGDLDLEEVIAAAARTIGVLPARRSARAYDERRVVPELPHGLEMRRTITTADRKAQLFLFFPLNDGVDPARRRALGFLGRVVDDRLRLEVRERLGAAYSPSAAVDASRVFPGLGVLMMDASTAPEGAEALVAACREVASTLARDGVSEEELTRLASPLINQVRDQRRTNEYWLRELAQAQSDPSSLQNPRTVLSFYESLNAGMISELAAQYLPPERSSFLLVLPQ